MGRRPNDSGGIDLNSSDAGDNSNYDFHSNQSECESAGGGTWYPDTSDTVTVNGGSPTTIGTIGSDLTGIGNQLVNGLQDAGYAASSELASDSKGPGVHG